MKIRVNLLATFKMIAGVGTINIDLPDGSTIQDIVGAVVGFYPQLRQHWLDADNELHAHVHVFVNGHDVMTLPLKMETQVKANDEVDFIPPVAGG